MSSKYKEAAIALCAIAFLTSGCTSTEDKAAWNLNQQAEAAGSLYRYRVTHTKNGYTIDQYRGTPPSPASVPTNLQPTAAHPELQKELLRKIAILQMGWGVRTMPVLLGATPLGTTGSVTKECWYVRNGTGADQYNITISQNANGATDFQVAGPLN